MTQPPPFYFCPHPLAVAREYHHQENFGIKDACRRILEHTRRKHQHIFNFSLPSFLIFVPEDFRDAFCGARVPLDTPLRRTMYFDWCIIPHTTVCKYT